jgi:AcrR family transcriptional regulator
MKAVLESPSRSGSLPAARGRPRCPDAHQAVLAAARKLLEEKGYGGVTMEGIARESGVGKPTIYRWWPTKGAIFREIYVMDGADFLGERSADHDLETDLRRIVRGLCRLYTTTPHGRALAGMFAEAQLDPRTRPDFVTGLQSLRQKGLQGVLRRAIARGELPKDHDLDLGSDTIFGPILYRLMIEGRPLNRAFADALVDGYLKGLRSWKKA